MLRGAIVRGMGGLYTARTPEGTEYVLRCKKKFRRMRMSPLVGDEILFTPGVEDEHGWLEEILPRKTECLRPPVANIELLLIVVAPVPAPDFMLVDRLLVRARQQELSAVLVVNKCDVDATLAEELRSAGLRVQLYSEQKKFKQKMAYADKLGVPFAVLLGEDEIAESKCSVKNMKTGEQVKLTAAEAAAHIRAALSAINGPVILEK